MHYIYCPQCGAKLVDRQAGDDGCVPYCESCLKYWFDAFSDCAIVLVANEMNEVALLQQNYLSTVYKTFVAGFIKPGETAESTAVREVEEELGITLDRIEYAGTYWFGAREQLMHGFVGFARKQPFVLSSEVDSAQWVSLPDVYDQIFPPTPENTQYPLIETYLRLTSISLDHP